MTVVSIASVRKTGTEALLQVFLTLSKGSTWFAKPEAGLMFVTNSWAENF